MGINNLSKNTAILIPHYLSYRNKIGSVLIVSMPSKTNDVVYKINTGKLQHI